MKNKEIVIDDSVGEQVFHNENCIVFVSIDYDQDTENPLSDSFGKIWSLSHKHSNYKELSEVKKILKKNPLAVPLSYFEHGNCIWGVQGTLNGTPDFSWDGTHFAGCFDPNDDTKQQIKDTAVKHLLPEGVKVEWKDGKVVLTINGPISGGCDDCKSFKNAYKKAIDLLGITYTNEQLLAAKRKQAIEVAEAVCAVYTAWCNGECYGFKVVSYAAKFDEEKILMDDKDDYDGEEELEEDSCWGFIGQDGIKYMIADHVKPFVEKALIVEADVLEIAEVI